MRVSASRAVPYSPPKSHGLVLFPYFFLISARVENKAVALSSSLLIISGVKYSAMAGFWL
jgi:hypothetical protein